MSTGLQCKCGKALPAGAVHCTRCGAKVGRARLTRDMIILIVLLSVAGAFVGGMTIATLIAHQRPAATAAEATVAKRAPRDLLREAGVAPPPKIDPSKIIWDKAPQGDIFDQVAAEQTEIALGQAEKRVKELEAKLAQAQILVEAAQKLPSGFVLDKPAWENDPIVADPSWEYNWEQLADRVSKGALTRAQVREVLGPPDEVQGSIWYYIPHKDRGFVEFEAIIDRVSAFRRPGDLKR